MGRVITAVTLILMGSAAMPLAAGACEFGRTATVAVSDDQSTAPQQTADVKTDATTPTEPAVNDTQDPNGG